MSVIWALGANFIVICIAWDDVSLYFHYHNCFLIDVGQRHIYKYWTWWNFASDQQDMWESGVIAPNKNTVVITPTLAKIYLCVLILFVFLPYQFKILNSRYSNPECPQTQKSKTEATWLQLQRGVATEVLIGGEWEKDRPICAGLSYGKTKDASKTGWRRQRKVPNASGQQWYQPYDVHRKRQDNGDQVWKIAKKKGCIVKTTTPDC